MFYIFFIFSLFNFSFFLVFCLSVVFPCALFVFHWLFFFHFLTFSIFSFAFVFPCFSFLLFFFFPFFLSSEKTPKPEKMSKKIPLLALVSEFDCRFLRTQFSMEMWCPDDMGRDSWDWVGPPSWERACFNSPEWGGGSSPVETEPPRIVLLLSLLLFFHTRVGEMRSPCRQSITS